MANQMPGSFYMSAVTSGMDTVNLMMGGDNAATTAAYNNAYQAEATRAAMGAAIGAAQKNIASVKQNRILSHIELEKRQDQAEAMAKVSAAAAGVEGSSVDDVVYTTKANESIAKGRANAVAEQQVEQHLASVHQAAMGMVSVQDQEIDYFGNVVNKLAGSVNLTDMQNFGTHMDETDFFGDKGATGQDITGATKKSLPGVDGDVWEGDLYGIGALA